MLTRPQWANKYAERDEKKLGADFAAETPRGLGLFEINSLPRQERGRLFDARRERFFRRFECAQVRAAKSRVIIELEEMVERTRAPSNYDRRPPTEGHIQRPLWPSETQDIRIHLRRRPLRVPH